MKRPSVFAGAALAALAALSLPATATAAPARLLPTGAAWTSAQHGIVLGYPSLTTGAKPSLLQTANDGKSWQSLPAPPLKFPLDDSQPDLVAAGGVIAVTDGTHILATRDSGKHWTTEKLAGIPKVFEVQQIATADGRVLALVVTRKQGALYSGTPQSGVLQPVKGVSIAGAGAYGDISTAGSLQVDLGNNFTTQKYWFSRNGTSFTAAPLPCPAKAVALLGGVRSGKVLALCTAGPSAVGPGTTAAQASIAAKLGGKFSAEGKQIELPNVSIYAAATPSTLIIGGEAGLFRTVNSGKTWTLPLTTPNGGNVNDLTFVSASTGFALESTSNEKGKVNTVYRTVNAGQKWTAISLP